MKFDPILIIDDDLNLFSLLDEYLSGEGFEIHAAHDGEAGLEMVFGRAFSLVILDIMLPGMNGIDVLRSIRKQSDIPVLMLTARGDDIDRIIGLEVGADDYLPKPFNPRELIARIRSILRRSIHSRSNSQPKQSDEDTNGLILLDDMKLNMERRLLTRKGEIVRLTELEFSLFTRLVMAKGQLVKRETLYLEILDREFSPLDRALDVHISNLRKKIGDRPGKAQSIKSVRGEGYLFAGAAKKA